jgi:heat shock protein HslJ
MDVIVQNLRAASQQIGEDIEKRHGATQAAILGTAQRVWLALYFYEFEPTAGDRMLDRLRRDFEQIRLPASLLQPLAERIGQRAKFEDVRAAVIAMDKAAPEHFLTGGWTPPGAATAAGPVLAGTSWRADNAMPPDRAASIRFEPNGAVSGFAGCNTFAGTYVQSGAKLILKDITPQKKDCADHVMIPELSFLTSIRETERFDIEGGKLLLKRESGRTMAQFVRR